MTAQPRLELLPAVDIAGGRAVQLVQGVAGSGGEFGDPWEAALRWQEQGAEWIHLVDLDAAFGRGSNRDLIASIVGAPRPAGRALRRHPRHRVARRGARHRLPPRQHRHGGARGPRVDGLDHRRARRPRRHRPRRPGHDARGAGLDPRGRRPLGDARASRRRGLRALRRHRRQQGRHAPGPQRRAAPRRVRAHRPSGRRERRRLDASRTSPRSAGSSATGSRAPSSARPSTAARSRCPRRSTSPGARAS